MFSGTQLNFIVAKLLRSGDRKKLMKMVNRLHSADIEMIMMNLLPAEQCDFLEVLFELKKAGKTLIGLPKYLAQDLLKRFEDTKLITLIRRMSEQESKSLLRFIPEERSQRLLSLIEREKSTHLSDLLLHPEDSAADLMSTDFFALPSETKVKVALEYPRQMGGEVSAFYVYVIDELAKLVGVVPIHQLLLVDPGRTLAEIMDRDVISVLLEASKQEIAEVITRYNLLSIPVVDDLNVLRGVVSIDSIIEVLQDETTEEMYKIAGLDVADRVFVKPLQSVRKRLPWMSINICTAMAGALVISFFSEVIDQMVALAFFMPVIAGLSGNTGAQTLTVIVRGIALGEVQISSARRVILKESLVGLTNGLAVGLVVALVAVFWQGPLALGLIVGLAMVFNFIIAALIGSIVPMTLKYLGFDPAIASNIFVTATTDLVGFFTYLGLASIFLSHLV
ncbi:magnesium transporter [bacterium]|nr:magnesium transporter [bacterium]